MRRGELFNTTWRDIDFDAATVEVTLNFDGEHTWEWHVKDSDRRTLPLTEDVLTLLAERQARAPEGCPYMFVPMSRYPRNGGIYPPHPGNRGAYPRNRGKNCGFHTAPGNRLISTNQNNQKSWYGMGESE